MKELQSLAAELRIAILIVTHLRKGADEGDPIDKISGTLGFVWRSRRIPDFI
jgi:hypothetical protein